MKLYLPTSSKNFSLIFETESVSPEIFYKNRTYGNTRFRNSKLSISTEYITLFSFPPIFHFEEEENFPMILEFESEALTKNLRDLHAFNTELEKGKIFIYPQTIYFDTASFRCIFLSEKHRKNTQIDSESYKNVKTQSKYQVSVESEDFFKKWNFDNINIQLPPNELKDFEIEKDKRFNHVKGYLYGYSIACLEDKSPALKLFSKIISDLQSCFTNAKAQIIIKNSEATNYKKNYSKFKEKWYSKSENYIDTKKEILVLIDNAEDIFIQNSDRKTLQKDDIVLRKAKEIINELKIEGADLNLINQFSEMSNLLEYRHFPFERLRNYVKNFFYLSNTRAGIQDDIEIVERQFKSLLFQISKDAEIQFSKKINQKEININNFIFENSTNLAINRNEIKLQNDSEYKLLELIITQILKNPRLDKKGEITREQKLNFIQSLGKSLNKISDNDEDYKNSLLKLYFSIKNYNSFNINELKSVVLKNYVSFIYKIDNLNELIDFNLNKDVKESQFSIAFWGAFNGFSEIDEKISRSIFASQNLLLINSFENYLNNILRRLDQETFDFFPENTENDDNWANQQSKNDTTNNEVTSIVSEFENKNITVNKSQYLNSLNEIFKSSPLTKIFNDTQKEDIEKGLAKLEKHLISGNEINVFVDKDYLDNFLIKCILEINSKRRKKDYKIEKSVLNAMVKSVKN